MRIAWLGPTPTEDSGVGFMASQLLAALARTGAKIDCYLSVPESRVPAAVMALPRLTVVTCPSGWEYDRWYSSTPLTKTVSGLGARAFGQVRLAEALARRHARTPYSLVYQFSHIETMALARVRRHLPPLVVHPEVHMAGELRWHTQEQVLSRSCEPLKAWLATQALLRFRSRIQRLDASAADAWITPSRRFANLLACDYGIPMERFSVVPNPIDLARFAPSPSRRPDGPVRLLFVSRMAVRKGVELFVAVSHRLRDLSGRLAMEAVGGPTLWSNYVRLLDHLNPDVASYRGSVTGGAMAALMRDADGVVQPSHYEPFALTVGESVASGTPVIVSDAVGAGEFLSERCCRKFEQGDVVGFEHAIRELVTDIEAGRRAHLGSAARAEAVQQFSIDSVSRGLAASLARFA